MNFLNRTLLIHADLFILKRFYGRKLFDLSPQLKYLPSSGCKSLHNCDGFPKPDVALPQRFYHESRWERFVRYFKNKVRDIKSHDKRNNLALVLFTSIDSINFQEFYKFLQMPDTFNSWFVIVELHMWMLMSQLVDDSESGLKLRNALASVMWHDVEMRIANFGVSYNRSVAKKQLKEISGRFPISLCVYDEGLLTNDITLASALWYKFFDKDCDDPIKLEVLVKYVRHQIQHLSLVDLRDYSAVQDMKTIWLPLAPHIDAVTKS